VCPFSAGSSADPVPAPVGPTVVVALTPIHSPVVDDVAWNRTVGPVEGQVERLDPTHVPAPGRGAASAVGAPPAPVPLPESSHLPSTRRRWVVPGPLLPLTFEVQLMMAWSPFTVTSPIVAFCPACSTTFAFCGIAYTAVMASSQVLA